MTAFLVKQFFFLRQTLTRTRLDTGRSKVKLPMWVGLGLKRDGVIGGGQWTVLFTYTAVVEVTTSLQRGRRKRVSPVRKRKKGDYTVDKKTKTTGLFTRQSESLGPVHPAAHCRWQQSLGRGPLHRWQPDAHLARVTLNIHTHKTNSQHFSKTSSALLLST